jgi:hypothetical protein
MTAVHDGISSGIFFFGCAPLFLPVLRRLVLLTVCARDGLDLGARFDDFDLRASEARRAQKNVRGVS